MKHFCRICGNKLPGNPGKTGCCRGCANGLPEVREVNSEKSKEAHAANPDRWRGRKTGGVASKEWRKSNPDKYQQAIKKQIDTAKKNRESGITRPSMLGKKLSPESRKKLSIKRLEFLETHPSQNVNWYTISGKRVQGTWEKTFAEYLDSRGIEWKRPILEYNKGVNRYRPDFFCPKENVYFEIKGFFRDADKYKMHLVLRENPGIKIVVVDKNRLNQLEETDFFSLPPFQEDYPFESIDFSKFDASKYELPACMLE